MPPKLEEFVKWAQQEGARPPGSPSPRSPSAARAAIAWLAALAKVLITPCASYALPCSDNARSATQP